MYKKIISLFLALTCLVTPVWAEDIPTANSETEYVAEETYTVRYHTEEGSSLPEPQTKQAGEELILSGSVPDREGYVFLGWATDAYSFDIKYHPGDVYTEDADLQLYAVWVFVYNGHMYALMDNSLVWAEAKAYCESLGGHLVTITTEEEQNAIYSFFDPYMNNGDFYIGLQKNAGLYEWVTGESVSYTNWGDGEPDNYNSDQDVIVLCDYETSGSRYHIRHGEWDDIHDAVRPFICEWEYVTEPETPTEPDTPEVSIPEDAVYFDGSYYKLFSPVNYQWSDAVKHCESLGGYMATISSQEENDFLYSYVTAQNATKAYFGYTDCETEGVWKWVKEEGSTYTNWAINEPNGQTDTENYASFFFRYTEGQWNDDVFDSYYICEWKVEPTEHIHEFADIFTVDIAPTCTTNGIQSRHCLSCDATTDETAIPMTGHNYSAWMITKPATIYQAGEQSRYCSYCSEKETEVIPMLTIDPNDPDYGTAHFTVVHAETMNPIPNANIAITLSDGEECILSTDDEGKTTQILPVGKWQMVVYKNGYLARNLSLKIESGEQDIPSIGISTRELVESSVSVKEMTMDEILDAGIDVTEGSNQQIYRYDMDIRFSSDFEWVSFYACFDSDGVLRGMDPGNIPPVVPGTPSTGGSDWKYSYLYPTDDGETPDSDGEKESCGIKYWGPDNFEASVYPVSENLYLIVYGEAKWLKEMYNVEMLVVNHSQTDTLELCQATLTLPEGLSLAAMSAEPQTLMQELETVGYGETRSVHWYVRGDAEGEYSISARLTGQLMPFEEKIDQMYVAENAIKVYAGSALHMNIYMPRVTYSGEKFPVKMELVNVSHKPVYNISSEIFGVEEGQITVYSNGTTEYITLQPGMEPARVFKQELLPGDSITVETTVDILFDSDIFKYKQDALLAELQEVFAVLDTYEALSGVVSMVSGTFTSVRDNMNTLLNTEMEEDKRAGLEALLSAIDTFEGYMSGDTVTKALHTIDMLDAIGKWDTLKQFAENPDTLADVTVAELETITELLYTVQTQTEEFQFESAICKFIECLPIQYFVENVMISTLAGSTTEIPYTIIFDENRTVQYFGIDSMGQYLYSLAIAAGGKIDIPWFFNVLGVQDDPDGLTETVSYIKLQEAQTGVVTASDGENDTQFRIWVENENGLIADDSLVLSSDNETAVYENGILTFTGSGNIFITVYSKIDGTMFVEADGIVVKKFILEIVDTHICNGNILVWEVTPTEDRMGVLARYCDICGELNQVELVELCDNHVFGEEIFAYATENGDCVYRACTICGYREYTIRPKAVVVGDINGDGYLSAKDRMYLSRALAKWEGYSLEGISLSVADLNKDGLITAQDRLILARHIAKHPGYLELPFHTLN